MFFSPANPDTALGMYSPGYFVTLLFFLIITIVAIILSRNMPKKIVRKVIIVIGIFLWITEFIKMFFTYYNYGIKKVEFIPLYFCSMTMYACMLLCFNKEVLDKVACSFLFFGGIIGAIAFFAHPSACIPNYPLFHFMTIRTFIFHSLMIYMGFLIVLTGFYNPSKTHFKYYLCFLTITFILAYLINIITGSNLMYIQEPLDIKLSQIVYEYTKGFYPFIFGALEAIVPFWISYGIYDLICRIKTNKEVCIATD